MAMFDAVGAHVERRSRLEREWAVRDGERLRARSASATGRGRSRGRSRGRGKGGKGKGKGKGKGRARTADSSTGEEGAFEDLEDQETEVSVPPLLLECECASLL